LLELYAPRLLGTAFAILRNREDAEEAVQEAAYQAFRSISGLRDERTFAAWFLRIVSNKSLDLWRRRRREENRRVFLEEPESLAIVNDAQKDMDLMEAVSKLPSEHRMILNLHFIEGYSTPEIARLLGKPEGTVRRRLSESYKILRLTLKEP